MKRIITLFMCVGFLCDLFAQMPPQDVIPEVDYIVYSKNTLDTNCDSSVALVRNPNFECGYNFYWDINFTGVTEGTFTDATTDARTKSLNINIDVTTTETYQNVIASINDFDFEINKDFMSIIKIDAIEASIYPNPTDGILSTNTVQKVEEYSLLGRLVNTYKPISEILDLSSLPKGVYFMSVGLDD